MAWQTVRQQRIYYESLGHGDAVLLLPGWAGSIIEFDRLRHALIDPGGDISLSRAADIRCASLLLTGTGDPVCPPGLVAAMADAMPRGTFREVPGAAHDVHRSHGPWLASTIAEWIGGH